MLNPNRLVLAIAILTGTVIGGAVLLQWFWAGWSVYSGPGPGLAARWLLTGVLGAALLLPPGAALHGAAVGRWIRHSGLRDQAQVTPAGARLLSWQAALRVLAFPWLTVSISLAVWALIGLLLRESVGLPAGLPGLGQIASAHGLIALIAGAFALWGAALAVGDSEARVPTRVPTKWVDGCAPRSGWVSWRQTGCWAAPALLLIAAGPALVGALLPHLARPERALDAALLVNPITAPGAALGMDILRSPRLYYLTRAPEYWYTYPPAFAVAAVYLMAAALGGYRLRRALERE